MIKNLFDIISIVLHTRKSFRRTTRTRTVAIRPLEGERRYYELTQEIYIYVYIHLLRWLSDPENTKSNVKWMRSGVLQELGIPQDEQCGLCFHLA